MQVKPRARWLVASLLAFLGIWLTVELLHPVGALCVMLNVSSYSLAGTSMVISVVVTNGSPLPLFYSGNPPFSEVKCRTGEKWHDAKIVYFSKSASRGCVLPGKVTSYQLTIDQKPERFRVSTYFETGGLRMRLYALFVRSGIWQRFTPTCDSILGLLPTGQPHVIQPWSPEIVVSQLK